MKHNQPKHGTSNLRVRDSFWWRASTVFGLISILTLIFALVLTVNVSAATRTITVNMSDSIVLDNFTVKSNRGSFATSSTMDTIISIYSDNYTGYKLGIRGASDAMSNALVNVEDPTKIIPSISSNVLPEDYADDTYAINHNLNNTWGYRPSTIYNVVNDITETNDNFLPAPNSNDLTLLAKTNSANKAADNYNIAVGVRADLNLASGSYTNSAFVFTVIPNPTIYSITYTNKSGITASNMPSNVSGGETYDTTTTLSDIIPERAGYDFMGWCSVAPTTNKTTNVDSCANTTDGDGTIYNPNGNNTNLDYTLDQISENDITVYAMWSIKTYTCTKEYRLQNADGTYPTVYTADGTETIQYNGTCSYSKSVANYTTQSGTKSNMIANQTISLDLPRSTFTLTVAAGTNTSSATGGGTYRWGQTVTVGVTKTANTTCKSYATPTWSRTSGSAGTFSSTSGTSVNFTMGTSNATVTATSAASNINQTITFKTSNATNITLNGNTKTNNQTLSIACGTYNITGTFPTGYVFNSWAKTSGAGSFASTSTLSTKFTVSGAATITLNGILQMQNVTSSTCTTTARNVKDTRDGEIYKIQKLADGKCWMLDNLRLDPSISTTLSNIATSSTNATSTSISKLKSGGGTTSDKYPTAKINNVAWTSSSQNYYSVPMTINAYKNTVASTKYGSGSGKIGVYYNYCAASAGSYCYGNGTSYGSPSGNATEDLCPAGWRMPTGGSSGEYQALYAAYSSNATNFKTALSVPLPGYFGGGSVRGSGGGYFWSSTKYTNDLSMYRLYASSSTIQISEGTGRDLGLSMRCVLK